MKNENTYQYDMHIHSFPCSVGGTDIREHIDALVEKGFSGMVITNHFYCGNNGVDRALPWEEFVNAYKQDYLYGLEYAQQLDFDLLFGLEEHVGNGLEILIYGMDPEDIAAHPELKTGDIETYVEVVHACGGMIYQAHPFRVRRYIKEPKLLDCLERLDGIEVYNGGNQPEENELAQQSATELGLKGIGGSDGHTPKKAGRSGIAVKERIRSNDDLIRILKSGEYTVLQNQ